MLKDDLERVIKKSCLYFIADPGKGSSVASELAQAIVDRLEIDEQKVFEIIGNPPPAKWGRKEWKLTCYECNQIARMISGSKPIKLKEERNG